MKKIHNIHLKEDPEVFQCFGCSPHNDFGLQLEFWDDDDELVSYWEPRKVLQSYPNVIHGGIQATLMDEIAGWVVYTKCGTVGFTADMSVRFKHALSAIEGTITIRARLAEQNKRIATIQAKLINFGGRICSEATIRYYLLPESEAREKFHYPGISAFYDDLNNSE